MKLGISMVTLLCFLIYPTFIFAYVDVKLKAEDMIGNPIKDAEIFVKRNGKRTDTLEHLTNKDGYCVLPIAPDQPVDIHIPPFIQGNYSYTPFTVKSISSREQEGKIAAVLIKTELQNTKNHISDGIEQHKLAYAFMCDLKEFPKYRLQYEQNICTMAHNVVSGQIRDLNSNSRKAIAKELNETAALYRKDLPVLTAGTLKMSYPLATEEPSGWHTAKFEGIPLAKDDTLSLVSPGFIAWRAENANSFQFHKNNVAGSNHNHFQDFSATGSKGKTTGFLLDSNGMIKSTDRPGETGEYVGLESGGKQILADSKGQRLAVMGEYGDLKLFNQNEEKWKVIRKPGFVKDFENWCYSPDGTLLAVSSGLLIDGRVVIYDTSSGEIKQTIICPDGAAGIVFSSDNKNLYISSRTKETINKYDLSAKKFIKNQIVDNLYGPLGGMHRKIFTSDFEGKIIIREEF